MNLKRSLEFVEQKKISIEIFGLGYVGFPLAIKLARAGFNIIGIDKDENKIRRLKKNQLIDYELNFKNEYHKNMLKQKIMFSSKSEKIKINKISIICVPTPIPSKFKDSNYYLRDVIESILKTSHKGDVILIESSVEVGTTEWVKNQIDSKGFALGKNYGLAFCPERIDPLNKKWTIHNIPRVIYCSDNVTFQITKKIYEFINKGNLIRVSSPKVAEVVKSFENSFRLVNISLVNELAVLCDKLEINVSEVLSAASTKPFGFLPFYSSAGAGGHCIPKDPIFLLNSAKKYNDGFQMINSALRINKQITSYIATKIDELIEQYKLPKNVIVCGLTYKENIEDMRDSPGFKLIRELQKLNHNVIGYDPYYDPNLLETYLIENKISKKFKVLLDLKDEIIKKNTCLVLVQHHFIMEKKINDIYSRSIIPIIYDCQNKISNNSKSKTILLGFGNKKG